MANYRPIFFIIGLLLMGLAALMLLPAMTELATGAQDWTSFVISAFLTAFLGASLTLTNHLPHKKLSIKQIFALTSISFLIIPAFATLPFLFSSLQLRFIDAYFESMAGFTATNASILSGLDHMPNSILLWRSLMQWVGGMAMIVVATSVLPYLRIGGMHFFKTETLEINEKMVPRITQFITNTASAYLLLTFLCTILLWIAGMSLFDAICHGLSTVSSGGFSTHDNSIAYFQSVPIELIITFFMIASALPYLLYLRALNGYHLHLFEDSQIWWFLKLILVTTLIQAFWLTLQLDLPFAYSLRHSLFNITSILTTTGFSSANYALWGSFSIALFFMLSVIGGCAGSTSGGIKIFRFQILYRTINIQLNHLTQPHTVLRTRYHKRHISEEITGSVMSFFVMFSVMFLFLSLGFSLTGLDFFTSLSAAASSLANLGPGLSNIIGPTGNFSSLTDSAKWLYMAGMLLGRLEFFIIIVCFIPLFWRH